MRGQPDALRLTTTQGAGRAVEGQVVQSHFQQKVQAVSDFLQRFVGDAGFALFQAVFQAFEPVCQLDEVHAGELTNVFAVDLEVAAFFLEAMPVASRAGLLVHEGLRPALESGGCFVCSGALDEGGYALVAGGVVACAGAVVHGDQIVGPVEDGVEHLLVEVRNGRLEVVAVGLEQRFNLVEDPRALGVFQGRDAALLDALFGIGDEFGGFHLSHLSESIAGFARAVGRVEAEEVGLRLWIRDPRSGAHQ